MNKVILIGNLTRDIELRYTQKGTAVASFTIAVKRRFSKENETDFVNCVAWGKTGEIASKYVGKGSQVGVVGAIKVRSYDKDGQKRYVTEVIVDEIEFLSKTKANTQDTSKNVDMNDFEPMDDDEDFGDLPL